MEERDSVYNAPNVAMIAPVPDLHWTTPMSLHLCEAPIVLTSEKYAEYYRWHINKGHYVIIDNGAAIGGTVSDQDLVIAAKMISADEIVVPDAMADSERTLKWAKKFIAQYAGIVHTLMLVPQGTDYESWCKSLKDLVAHAKTQAVPRYVIGIGKHMHARVNGGRAILVHEVLDRGLGCHLLGASDQPLVDVRLLDNLAVRSLDTSLPFVMAQEGCALVPEKGEIWSSPEYREKRPPLNFLKSSGMLGRTNLETYLGWVKSGRRAVSNA